MSIHKTKIGTVNSPVPLKYIVCALIEIRSEEELCNPKANAIVKVATSCAEYSDGQTIAYFTLKKRTFVVDMEKREFFWEYTGKKYPAINHDEMFMAVEKLIKDSK